MLMRIQVEIASSTIDSRNGKRQPQVSNWSPLIYRLPSTTNSDNNRPNVAVDWMKPVCKPRLPGGACSAT
ncbi:hypothetical protein D9M71_346450 [compost metagenome]